MNATHRSVLKRYLEEEGAILVGVVPLGEEPDFSHFDRWLREQKHAGMHYLENNRSLRENPTQLLAGAQSAIVFAIPYDQPAMPAPQVARYARISDYHVTMRRLGERVWERFSSCEPSAYARVVVDSAPVLERALAARTGAGFLGKNTCFIHWEAGSFLLLGEILTTLPASAFETSSAPVVSSQALAGGCAGCDRCQAQCPTGALDDAYHLDSSLCLSYWTIEHRGAIPEKFWPYLKDYYFGCDICQEVCPYNGRTTKPISPSLRPREYPPLFEVATMDTQAYGKFFGGTALTRAKRNGLRRNALIAMAVTEDPKLFLALEIAKTDGGEPIDETVQQIERGGFSLGSRPTMMNSNDCRRG